MWKGHIVYTNTYHCDSCAIHCKHQKLRHIRDRIDRLVRGHIECAVPHYYPTTPTWERRHISIESSDSYNRVDDGVLGTIVLTDEEVLTNWTRIVRINTRRI